MHLRLVVTCCAVSWILVEPSAWAIPQCEDEPDVYSVRGWSESEDRVAIDHEVVQACTGGTRRDTVEIYEASRPTPAVCFDGFSADPSTPVPCDQVRYIGIDEAWGGADVFSSHIPTPEGFVPSSGALSTRSATVWATDGKDSTTYELEVFGSGSTTPTSLPLGEVEMFRWASDREFEATPVSVSVSVSPSGRKAVVLLSTTELDDDMEFTDMRWVMVDLPSGVRLATSGEPTTLEPSYVRCDPSPEEDDAVGPGTLRAIAKARVHQRVGNVAHAFSILLDAINAHPRFTLGWTALLDVALADDAMGRAVSMSRRLQATCPAFATEVLAAPRFDGLRARSSGAEAAR